MSGFPPEQTNEYEWPETDTTYANDFNDSDGEEEKDEETLGIYLKRHWESIINTSGVTQQAFIGDEDRNYF